ncbi:ATP-binding protein [Kitasatospora mediocidica]|uniref:ATP-binding protein n=1 Tax=Kitasatospora mediocidica TaxID=58352 RepID=UPI0012FBF8E8|nr:tetratricopeptide repeat protein [Kitasatospora mediocidica]
MQHKTLQFLTALLLAPGLRASHVEIMSCVWPGENSKPGRIRQYSHKLRQAVPDIFVENGDGFCRIQLAAHQVDYMRSQEHRNRAAGAPNPPVRLAELRSALAEWRGEPLEGLTGPGFVRRREALLSQLQETTCDCIQAELECGQHRAALQRVDDALERWPDSETLLELKVRTLTVLGRPDEVEPLLTDWEQRFGRSTGHLLIAPEATPTPTGTHGMAPRPTPRQLPPRPADLIGRDAQVDQVSKTLLGRTEGRSRIAVVCGMPGVGKTLLAVRTAHEVEQCFPDGTLYLDLGGFSSREPERYDHRLARLLNNLGVRPDTPTRDGMLAAYRTALADRAVLLILDNARDEQHVRQLLPGPGSSAAIVTSRRQLHSLWINEGADIVDLAPLNRRAAVELLRTKLGTQRMNLAAPFLDDFVEHCAGIPLALTIIAAQIRRRPAGAIGEISRSLREASTRLRLLDLGSEETSVQLSFEVSHNLLPPEAKQLFWQLAVHPGPTISWSALRALSPDDPVGLSDAFEELQRNNLVTETSASRYALHDLLRAYAGELAARQSDSERAEVAERVLEFLLQNAAACDRRLDSARGLPIGRPQGIRIDVPADAAEAMVWFEAEYSTLTAVIGTAEAGELDRYSWLLPMVLVPFQWRSGRYLDALRHLTGALEAARRVAAPADIAMVHRMLGGTHRGLGDLARATRELRSAVLLSGENGDLRGTALGHHTLGVMLRENGAPSEALEHLTTALAAFRELEDVLGQGTALSGIGVAHYDLRRYGVGLEYCQRSLNLLIGTDDVNSQAFTLFSLGRIKAALGDLRSAVTYFVRAVRLYRSLAYSSREARTLICLADTLLLADRPLMAAQGIARARALLTGLDEGDPDAAIDRLRSQL